jgi:hypothetical protein
MHGHRFLGSLIVTAALLAPVSAQAAVGPKRPQATVQLRVYDRAHKDYHVWDDHEDRAYRQYLGDQHRKYRGYSTLSHRRQTTYWNYRHTHAD